MVRMQQKVLALLMFTMATALAGPDASAQAYPNRAITFVAPFAAGGDADLSGRNLANVIPKYLGQPVVVVNQAGASGVIGSQRVRLAPPDGYTLLVARIGSQAIQPAIDSKTPYKWNDFTFLSVLELNPYVCVVKNDAPYRTMKDLVDHLRANPGKLNYASAGNGTIQHLGVQYLFNALGLPKEAGVHIPYKGGGEATAALLSNQVQFICNNLTTMLGQIKGNAIRAVMTTTAQRLKELPDVPTARELGWPQLESLTGWSALFGPPGMPADIVQRWVDALAKVATDADWLKGNETMGGIPSIRTPADTEKFVREQFELYDKLGTALGIKQ